MEEMYWITRLNGIIIFLIIIGVLAIVSGIACFSPNKDNKKYPKEDKIIRRFGIISFIISFICLIGVIFIPTENQMYKIIGIGGTYDYIKNNDNIKQIPDNTIKALEIWSNNIILDQQIENKELKQDSINNN